MADKNSFAPDPPMGWNSWDVYGAAVTEELLLQNTDYMAANLKEYGWQYIVCDVQWYCPTANSSHYQDFADLCVDEYGRCIPAPNRFPSAKGGEGFKRIADYVHDKGLKFGIHIMRGIPRQAVHDNCPIKGTGYTARQIAHPASICSWNTDMYGIDANKPGAQEYYNSILELYAYWGVDFIKVDDISVKTSRFDGPEYGAEEVELIRRAIDQCGRPIVLSLSPGPAFIEKAKHLQAHANMWRITGDFWDEWSAVLETFRRCNIWAPFVKDGSYPDSDMLPLGHISIIGCEHGVSERMTRFSKNEQITVLSLWSIFRSPLMLGCELTDLDDWTKSLITNRGVIALNKRSRNAHQIKCSDTEIVWIADDSEGSWQYLAMFNIAGWDEEISLDRLDIGPKASYKLYDIWDQREYGRLDSRVAISIPSHGAKLFRITSN